jgi:hypothetical protein
MELARQARNLGTEVGGFLIGVAQTIVAGLIIKVLQKMGTNLAVRLSYPWELFQIKVLLKASREAFLVSLLYPMLKDSRKLSPLFPIMRFYLRGYQRLVWTVASMPTVKKSLANISQRNLGTKTVSLTTATLSAEVLAEEFSTSETDTSWLTSFLFSSMFQLASMTIVDPTRHPERDLLLRIRNRLIE